MYVQNLYKVIHNHIKPKILKRNNRYKKWETGYNEEHDVIIISKTGKIGEIYEIQGLKVALPLEENVYKRSGKKEEQYWEVDEYPKDTCGIKSHSADIQTGRNVETGSCHAVHKLHDRSHLERRESKQEKEASYEHRPDKEGQSHPRHPLAAQVDYSTNEVHRTKE